MDKPWHFSQDQLVDVSGKSTVPVPGQDVVCVGQCMQTHLLQASTVGRGTMGQTKQKAPVSCHQQLQVIITRGDQRSRWGRWK